MLLFHQGKLTKVLSPGKHTFRGSDYTTLRYDMRLQLVQIPNQELTCKDGITVKVSAKASYRILDAEKVYRATSDYYSLVYASLHESLRDAIAELSLEEALGKRADISSAIQAKSAENVRRLESRSQTARSATLALLGRLSEPMLNC